MKKISMIIFLILVFTSEIFSEVSPKKYNKIISMSLASDEMVYELIDHSRILAISGHSSNNKMVSNLYGKIDDFKKIDNNIEIAISLEPDLVIAATWLKKDMVKQLEESGINVYVYKTPRTFEEEKALIMELAKLLEVEDKGKEIIKDIDLRYEKLQRKIKKLNLPPPKILEYSHFGTSNGSGTLFDSLVTHISAINLVAEKGIKNAAKLSKETIIEINPDIIVVPCWEDLDIEKNRKEIISFITEDPSFKEIEAVKNNRILILPGRYLYVYSQYIIEAMEELANLIYEI